jgi:hypothetical protein
VDAAARGSWRFIHIAQKAVRAPTMKLRPPSGTALAQHRRGQADVLVQQVARQREPGQLHAIEALGIGQVGVQLGIGRGLIGFEGGQAILLLRAQDLHAAGPGAGLVAQLDTIAGGRLQGQVAEAVEGAARGIGKDPAGHAFAVPVVADLGFHAADGGIALRPEALGEFAIGSAVPASSTWPLVRP